MTDDRPRVFLSERFIELNHTTINPVVIICHHLKPYLVSNLEDANVVFYNKYPIDKNNINGFKNKYTGKKRFCIWVTDETKGIDTPPGMFIYRTSGYKSTSDKGEDGFGWCSPIFFKETFYNITNKPFDPLYNDLSVGFCGAGTKTCQKDRLACLEHFRESGIKCDYIRRSKFIRGFSQQEQETFRKVDFIENMKNNIFSIAPRGGGNWSLRFYEAMAYGRIPVLINTDVILPFTELIDWKNVVVFADTNEELEKIVREWYNNGEDFIKEKQRMCRWVWDKHLSMEGFVETALNNIMNSHTEVDK